MKVLIIPEDFRYDQYMLQPLVTAMMRQLGRPKAKVVVCQAPLLGGVAQATNWEKITEILDRYPMIDLFLLCVDRDGKAGRREQLDQIEQQATAVLPASRALFAENGWQEIEVWILAGHDLPGEWNWSAVRAEIDPKERYFFPLAEKMGLPLADKERIYKELSQEAGRQYNNRVRRLCDEVAALESKIQKWLQKTQSMS